MALRADEVNNSIDFSCSSEEIKNYLLGQSLRLDGGADGWTLILVDGISIGWGKAVKGQIKNHYPKGLRRYDT